MTNTVVLTGASTQDNAITKLTRDLSTAAATLTDDEARFLVDSYYITQKDRIRAGNQVRALSGSSEPHEVLAWLTAQSGVLENQIKRALLRYAEANKTGQWAMSITGIGPVIAAGLLAHIDIHKAATAGQIWRYAGLDPTSVWGKGEKRPWNASLKTLCWKIGESFVKVKGKESDFYGKVYEVSKARRHLKNDAGGFSELAASVLKRLPNHRQKETYAAGKLPDGHIHAQAKREAVKLFIAHLHEVWRKNEGLPIVAPYPIAHLGHAHKIEPPNQ